MGDKAAIEQRALGTMTTHTVWPQWHAGSSSQTGVMAGRRFPDLTPDQVVRRTPSASLAFLAKILEPVSISGALARWY